MVHVSGRPRERPLAASGQIKVRRFRVDTATMGCTMTSEVLTVPAMPTGHDSWHGRLVNWVVAARSHRVICLLVGLWVFSVFDAALTILAHRQGMLDESNPIARHILSHSPFAILIYKVVLVSFASYVLAVNRTRLVAELAAGGMLFIYTIVAIQWRLCYELYMLTHGGHVGSGEIDAIDITILTSQFTIS